MYTSLVPSPDSAPPQVESDSIPRVSHLLAHLRDQLVGMRENTTFEAARRRYAATVERLEFEGVGRRTTSRGDEATAYWSPTVEVLEEAMRLGFVEREQLPSARRYVDAHRARVYRLSPEGQDASELAQRQYGEFVDRITVAIIDGHPYFRRLLELLDERPLMIPVISQGDLDRARTDGRGTQWWAEYVAGILNEAAPTLLIDADEVTEEIGAAVRKRFGARPDSPTSKAVSEALNDAFAAAAVRARGLPVGATNLKNLRRWGTELRILDLSRHVAGLDGREVIWLAADLESANGHVRTHRRGLSVHGADVAVALVSAYRRAADERRRDRVTGLDAPYIPIFLVRAQAAFESRVTRALCDIVLEHLVTGGYPELGVEVQLHLTGAKPPPPSEPIYRRGGSRRYEMTMTTRRQVSK
jgi:hypothetical protein